MHLTSRNPQLARRNNKAWNTLPSWRSLRPRSSTKWRNLKIFLKQYLGTTPLFIPYVSYWGVRSYSTNQPALHSFNYHLRASLAWSEGREEGGKYRGDLQDFSQSSPYNCVVIMISKSALQIPLWSDIFRLKSVGEAWGEVRVTCWFLWRCWTARPVDECELLWSCQIRVLNNINTSAHISASIEQEIMSGSSLKSRKWFQMLCWVETSGAQGNIHYMTRGHADMSRGSSTIQIQRVILGFSFLWLFNFSVRDL